MNPQAGKAWFQIAVFITVVSAGLLFFQKPGTAEFVISVTTLVIGIAFIALLVIMIKFGSRCPPVRIRIPIRHAGTGKGGNDRLPYVD